MAVDLKNTTNLVSGKVGGLWTEFKNFAFKGNLIDLAVAVVLGKAFGDVIAAIVGHIIMPLVSYVDMGKGGDGGYRAWMIGRIEIGAVLAELLNFLLVAGAVFIVIVKLIGAVMKKATAAPVAGAPTTKECVYCLSMIPIKATRCAHCTSDLTVVPGATVGA